MGVKSLEGNQVLKWLAYRGRLNDMVFKTLVSRFHSVWN